MQCMTAAHISFARPPSQRDVVIRMATAGDRDSLEHLAELDSSEPPIGPALIGVLSGRAVAARSLSDGTEIADPFVLTGDVLELLRLRARQLTPTSRPRRRPPSLRRRSGLLATLEGALPGE